ncbi:MAG: hypothetical protein ABIP55_04070 [Tepidisphaeraceae bacterium]
MSQNSPKFPTSAEASHESVNPPPPALTENQLAAIELLLQGRTMSAVSKSIKVDRKTLYNWRGEDLFRAELSRRRRLLWGDAAERLRAMIHPALDVLDEHLSDVYDRARFRGATAVLRIADLRKAVQEFDEPED